MVKSNNIRISGNSIIFNDGLEVGFQRTLRIPDDGKHYPLPPGLGHFPIRRVEDYQDKVPSSWLSRGGVFIPMYQREAMWIRFGGEAHKPRAVKVGIGKVCALTGKRWSENLREGPQDYAVAPPQPWLDGIATGEGSIRHFIAMPLGMGYTVEGQVTGKERFGGIQLKVFEPRPGLFPDEPPPMSSEFFEEESDGLCLCAEDSIEAAPSSIGAATRSAGRAKAASMGLGAGGQMTQKIYPDTYGLATWDKDHCSRVFVHIVNSELWHQITGEQPPRTPVTARTYAQYGLPWFDLYDEQLSTLPPSNTLAGVKSVKVLDEDTFGSALQDDETVYVDKIKKLLVKAPASSHIQDGEW